MAGEDQAAPEPWGEKCSGSDFFYCHARFTNAVQLACENEEFEEHLTFRVLFSS